MKKTATIILVLTVMASRQDDGLYTRPYIIHVDANGKVTKPFLLPQSDASYYLRKMQSYNLPEFVGGKVTVNLEEAMEE